MASRWRPKNRRQILQLDDEGSESHSIQNNFSMNTSVVATCAPTNKLHELLGHYNSDDEDSSKEAEDSEFKDFMNEIKSAEEAPAPTVSSVWQELWDPQSGQPYFWHTITNELTWEKPLDLLETSSPKTKTVSTTVNTALEENRSVLPGAFVVKEEPTTKITVAATLPAAEKPNLAELKKEDLCKKDDSKVSFKIGAPEKNPKVNRPEFTQAKTNGRLMIDVDSIIAAIEKEIPPDHKTETFVPLFRRRPQQSPESRPKLGNDFKKFFPLIHQPVLDLEPDSPPRVVHTFKGLGFQEKEDAPTSTPSQKVQFIAGEILQPLVVVPPVVVLTVAQKVTRLENRLASEELLTGSLSKTQLSGQLEILKEAWGQKKLETDFLEEWLDRIENEWKLEPVKSEKVKDQVIDMVLEDSEGDNSATLPEHSTAIAVNENEDVVECLDSALNSFYTDLATLETPTSPAAPVDPVVVALPDATPEIPVTPLSDAGTSVTEEEISSEPIKGIKRTKMSSDMSSLVAKWQKIHQTNT